MEMRNKFLNKLANTRKESSTEINEEQKEGNGENRKNSQIK